MYDENFKKNFKDVSRKEIGKEFHKKMKNFTGYTAAQTIADLEEGPFISDKDQKNQMKMKETLRILKYLQTKRKLTWPMLNDKENTSKAIKKLSIIQKD